MFDNNAFLTLSVGYPSPYPTIIAGTPQKTGAILVVDDELPIIVMMMCEPSQAEIDNIAGGSISVALDRERNTAFLLWRIASANRPPMFFETSLHVGLEKVDHFPSLAPEGPEPGLERAAVILVQDEVGIVRLIRLIAMPRPILEALAPLLIQQVAARCDRKMEQRHRADLQRFFARTPDPVRAFDLAPIKGQPT